MWAALLRELPGVIALLRFSSSANFFLDTCEGREDRKGPIFVATPSVTVSLILPARLSPFSPEVALTLHLCKDTGLCSVNMDVTIF